MGDRKPVASAEAAVKLLGSRRPSGHLLRIERDDGALYIVVGRG